MKMGRCVFLDINCSSMCGKWIKKVVFCKEKEKKRKGRVVGESKSGRMKNEMGWRWAWGYDRARTDVLARGGA
jgi:hypothetical protein